ncbi:type II secretion system protein [Leptolyngbya sp. FACHB-671]|uniref:type II secretion system protein n=1 Tax=Leptolyngbya sp. FACHB-671 TaxID=2692812 RepID=UPI001682CC9B|nr:type II secretion system protein [Leptolyngbya sp. FACHB-671]MBD1871135.1 type II secretion system protein [Cyanobacteria bacterium FACHB-471]MBD2069265.1 type II secretion system protein [Leptolyngbya sp. FACHB-671]
MSVMSLLQQQLKSLDKALLPGKQGGNPSRFGSSEQGVTLLECLVAISVIALLGAMITPPLFVAAATRVQNRRAEQAFQLAQSEVDRIRALVARGQHQVDNLPVVVDSLEANDADPPTTPSSFLKSINETCNTYEGQQIPANQVLPIDITGDADCEPEFLMQVYRTRSPNEVTEAAGRPDYRPLNFDVGIRVYSVRAEDNLGSLSAEPASLQFTTGEGNQRERPLAVLNSAFKWSDQSGALCNYHTNGGQICN